MSREASGWNAIGQIPARRLSLGGPVLLRYQNLRHRKFSAVGIRITTTPRMDSCGRCSRIRLQPQRCSVKAQTWDRDAPTGSQSRWFATPFR